MPLPGQSLPAQLRHRDRPRLKNYADNLRFYEGDQWTTSPRRTERRLTFNYARTILHKATAYLMAGRTVTVEPAGPSDHEKAAAGEIETALLQVWDQNGVDALDFETELDTAVLGDGAYKVWWDAEENRVRIVSLDPSGVFVWRWPDDPARVWRVANRYTLDADDTRETLTIANAGFIKKRNIITEVWTRDAQQLYINDDLDQENANPYGLIPFVVFPNIREPKQTWGTSDIPPIRDALRELNRAFTQLSKILELSGNPIAVLEGVTDTQDIAVTPGAVWELPPDAKAYLLDLLKSGGVRLHIDYLNAVYRALHDLGETPRAAFGDTARDLSGVALELELDPLVKKIDRKRLIRTHAYAQRNDIILALLDLFAGTSFGHPNHSIAWGSVLPTDRERQVRNEQTLVAAGIHSRRFAADALGEVDDPDAEFDRWLDEQQRVQSTSERSPTNAQ